MSMNTEINLLDLPREMLLLIMSFLPTGSRAICGSVSKLFYNLFQDSSLWKGVFIQLKLTSDCEIPTPRLWSAAAIVNEKMYIVGGHTTPDFLRDVRNEIYEFDLQIRKVRRLDNPSLFKVTEHKCVEYNGLLWFIGGYSNFQYTNQVYSYNPAKNEMTLVHTTGEPFPARSALTAVIYKNKIYVFGGWNGVNKKWYNDLYELNLKTWHWRMVKVYGTVPMQRTSHTAVVYQDSMYVFAGYSGEKYLNDMFRFDFETQTWHDLTHEMQGKVPAPRSRFSAVVHGNFMYVLGGWQKTPSNGSIDATYFTDYYSYNFVTKVWTEITSDYGRIPGLSQYAISNYKDLLYVFGGFDAQSRMCSNAFYVYKLPSVNI